MSRYLIRHIEAKYEQIDGQVWNTGDLFKKENVKDRQIIRVNSPDHRFYVSRNGKWEPDDVMPEGAELIGTCDCYSQVREQFAHEDGKYIKVRLGGEKYVGYSNGSWTPYPSEMVFRGWRLLKTYGTPTPSDTSSVSKKMTVTRDGKDMTMLVNEYWCNNGGAIRDDYISSQWGFKDCPFRQRGIPDDISPETRESMTYDGKISGYSHTWATVSEWASLDEAEEERLVDLIKTHVMKTTNRRMEDKIDFIISHMKDPMSIRKENVPGYVPDVMEEDEDIEIEDEYADDEAEFNEELSEQMSRLYLIAEEIGKAELIAEQNGVYSSDIRIIYYIE